ncbi:PQQ-dependent sugar dehydrogenase [Bacteriovorax sp. PP10]|uniref:PQQ-dependent sugar dehydrogenase n=1 Tax=Bacteriovorax antarcticus TaxID=3088717 RepID=A0ABU5VSE6_9BACT|nr:PQQ-dependent sugar dehydrogenase [Bacteriovorax sp. PP10]MEA9355274.1 PQQ-dependent sugar dehydrogenase [Bacteriovorax sp. PP10]
MKNLILVLLSTTLITTSCSHLATPPQAVTASAFPVKFQDTKWMDQEDYVRYVNFFTRAPSSLGSVYKMIGDCDGFSMVDVKTAPGFCLGQVYDGTGLKKPRTAAVINDNQIAVADMGSWEPYDGKIVAITFEKNGESTLKDIINSKSFSDPKDPRREIINRPHQITRHIDGLYYVGAATSLLRFNPLAENPISTIEVLVQNLPAEGLHPLKSFAFDESGSIFINVGAATNVCHKNGLGGIFGGRKKTCDEAEDQDIGQGQIRRYKMNAQGVVSKSFEIYAKGLRNSVALSWDAKRKILLQGENSRDAIEKNASRLNGSDVPHDEINIVEKDKHYGWPYCYDNNENSPEWEKVKCDSFKKPHMFLPAHSAPLSFMIYQGSTFPEWYKGRLLASLHGFEAKGHRIVTFKRDSNGLPTGTPQSVVYGWDTRGEQKYGSPVGLTEMPDGSVIIIEDMNKKVLRLAYDPSLGDGKPVEEIETGKPVIDALEVSEEENRRLTLLSKIASGNAGPFTKFQAKVIDTTCYICHGGANAPGIQLLRYDDVGNEEKILKANKAKELFSMVSGVQGYPTMPPQGFASDAEKAEAVNLLKLWIEQIQ